MRNSKLAVLLVSLILATQFGCASSSKAVQRPVRPAEDPGPPPGFTVYLVRHAEKTAGGRDPQLSEAGVQRASALASVLGNAGLDHVHSSNYRRTRNTALPTAQHLGMDLELYDPRNLDTLAEKLTAKGGYHLVVGHSNTTPSLVRLLGGEPGDDIREKTEFDRIYAVTRDRAGVVRSVQFRYGAPSP